MSQGFDLSELAAYGKDIRLVAEKAPKRQKQFLQKEGAKLRNKTKAQARKLGKKTGNYLKSIKRGKVYDYRGPHGRRVLSHRPPPPPFRGGEPFGPPRRPGGGVCQRPPRF